MFSGCGTALVTPFRTDLSLDEETLRKLVRRQIRQGINFLVPCGTTGESPTLEPTEHQRVVEITIEEANGRVPVLAGAGGYNTAEVIRMAKRMEALGANGILSVTPYYNKPTQEGLYQHYKAIAEAINLPIIVYSVWGRTGINVLPATLQRLAEIDNIIGVKEASGNIGQMGKVIAMTPDDFIVLSGDDAMTLPLLALGGHGLISVAGNEIPAEMTALVQAGLAGEMVKARDLHFKYLPLMDANFLESNPIPVKAVMGLMGLLDPVMRLPMTAPHCDTLSRLEEVLKELGIPVKEKEC
jgi:4-hydroxy-tetrahydrodipicolinate synthase